MAGTDAAIDAMVAPTVPENTVTGPRLAPSLVPDTTRSGGSVRMPVRPRNTLVAGVASTAYSFALCWMTVIRSRVTAALLPLRLVRGATRVTLCPASVSESLSAWMPTESQPSSLVSRMSRPCAKALGAVPRPISRTTASRLRESFMLPLLMLGWMRERTLLGAW
jgi:hypothetical protein